MLACFDTAENEPCKVCPLSAYRSPRYANTMVKNAVAALRGPVLLLVSLHMGFAVRFDFFVALSAVVGGASACWFLTLGRPKKGD